jgi:hypothetical protein
VGVGRLRGRDAIREGKLRLVGIDRHGGSIGNSSRGRRMAPCVIDQWRRRLSADAAPPTLAPIPG